MRYDLALGRMIDAPSEAISHAFADRNAQSEWSRENAVWSVGASIDLAAGGRWDLAWECPMSSPTASRACPRGSTPRDAWGSRRRTPGPDGKIFDTILDIAFEEQCGKTRFAIAKPGSKPRNSTICWLTRLHRPPRASHRARPRDVLPGRGLSWCGNRRRHQ
jgi:hypothetical protein